jgi:hypothetical protein
MNTPLPMKTAYKLKKLASAITDEQTKYEELRKELLTRLGDKDDNGQLVLDKGVVQLGDKAEEYHKQHQDLLNIEVEVGEISIDEIENAEVTATELVHLGDMLVD